jgi:hypothetical protein
MAIDVTKTALKIAHRLRDKSTEQKRIPFESGDLRKSIQVNRLGVGKASVGSVLPYARAVHDGRRALTIKPNLKYNPPLGKRTLRIGKNGPVVSKARYKKRARLKFKIGGRTIFARSVKQKPRRPQPFIREAAAEMDREGYDWLLPSLEKETTKGLAKKFTGNIKLTVSI